MRLQYKDIVLFLRKYHSVHFSERTLKMELREFGLHHLKPVDDVTEARAREIIKKEIFAGPDRLNVYCSMWYVLR